MLMLYLSIVLMMDSYSFSSTRQLRILSIRLMVLDSLSNTMARSLPVTSNGFISLGQLSIRIFLTLSLLTNSLPYRAASDPYPNECAVLTVIPRGHRGSISTTLALANAKNAPFIRRFFVIAHTVVVDLPLPGEASQWR